MTGDVTLQRLRHTDLHVMGVQAVRLIAYRINIAMSSHVVAKFGTYILK